ncbi:MAG: Holliday junction resolvase RuvX [Clostridia bacterium]|nr:Holliday junction resolvase RuvX [Clostridia bacterium]
MEKRVIALDIGGKRIGVAISDPFGEYAMPCETYHRTKSFWTDVEAVAKIAKDRGAEIIVCGMPVNFDGSESIQTLKTQEFVDALRSRTDLPIVLEDERFTTMQAREVQIQGGVKRDDRKKSIDAIAAAYILDGYLSREQKRRRAEAERQSRKWTIKSGRRNFTMDMEKLSDEEYEELNVIELEDGEGNVESFLHIATIEYKGQKYCCFQVAEPETEEEEDEIVIFRLEGEGEDTQLFEIEDEALLDEVFAEFCAQYEQYENAEDAKRLEV